MRDGFIRIYESLYKTISAYIARRRVETGLYRLYCIIFQSSFPEYFLKKQETHISTKEISLIIRYILYNAASRRVRGIRCVLCSVYEVPNLYILYNPA